MRISRLAVPCSGLWASAFTLAMAGRATAQDANARSAPAYVEAVGAAEGRATADRATLSLTVETRGASAAGIAAANARIQRAVLDTLASLGFRPPVVSTRGFSVAPNFETGPQGRRQAGHVARNVVVVQFTDLSRIGTVIDAALARGATGVGNLAFASSAADSALGRATRDATAKARAQAEAMADALGGRLGPLLHASTTPLLGGGAGLRAAQMDLSGTPITPSDVVLSVTVLTRWQFVGGR